ncbi:tRNA-dihydrouridine(20a/20b) synthase [NAD(P)+]-like [Aplysia californica]|uniref:tRNA-dihydrouridine synthase n=1 Tax=Aplysia californica TaxID=6500 RepID=A0ABM0JSN4_APLCA|nr:tRNA-dihydrouridine(20a/20b) synthase [NAD(P)+]-like [Aplysia californica]XP_005100581.1 tRNA-dihydrouridine(20a/20b) synthase [NAD(P)+]-like [Aplysia californica]XP_005100583.1 tRNA-dihydrouridine(20a/20b) synthase [NAD(P)+]-like [Aplysia californica]
MSTSSVNGHACASVPQIGQGDQDDCCADFQYQRPLDLFQNKKLVKICAPMVRYSKQGFRMLVRKYDCDLTFTPMIISNSFVRSIKARDSDFTTYAGDRPLIVQFASNSCDDFANATEIVAPYCDGVDLNCGCPQRWAMSAGYGSCLLKKPELVCDMVKQARCRVDRNDFTVSMKIRIHKDLRETVDMCQKAAKTGVSFISVHGRTKEQRAQPVNLEAVRAIKDAVAVPVVANGDIRSLEDSDRVQAETGVDGVMAARGILANPAMYAGYKDTPLQCVQDWVDIALSIGTQFPCFHHHLIFMLEHILSKAERNVFNSLASLSAVLDFLRDNLGIT